MDSGINRSLVLERPVMICQSEDVQVCNDAVSRLVVIVHYELRAIGGELVEVERKDGDVGLPCFRLLPTLEIPESSRNRYCL